MTQGFGALSVEITADATSFAAALKNAEGQLASTQARMNRTLAAVEKGFKSVAGGLKDVLGPVFSLRSAFATLLGAGGIGLLAKNALDAADAIVDMADRIGISTDALQELMYVASQSGLSVEQLETGLRKLNENIASAAAGQKNNVLTQLGIAAKDAAGNVRPLSDVLLEVADAFQKVGPQSAAGIKILTEAFGSRAGTAFAGALKDGAAGVRELIEDARRLGLVLEGDLLRGAASANDALDRMKMVVGTNLTRVLLQLAPTIETVAKAFADAAPGIQAFTDKVTGAIFGLQALSLQGLKRELDDVNAALDRENRLDAAARKVTPFGLNPRGNAVRDQLEQRKAELEAMMELRRLEDEARSRLPAGGGAVPLGMRERPPADKMAEYLAGLRESVQLAQTEAKEREVLEAILRAEAIAREQNAAGLRQSAELSAAERDSITAYVQLRQEATEREKEAAKAREDGKRLYEETRTAAEIYAAELERINQLLSVNAINEETANRARANAKKAFDAADEGAKQAKEASDQLAISFESAFQEAVAGGKSIGDIFEALIQDIVKMIVQLYILKPLMNAIAQQFNSLLGGGGSGGGGSGNFGFLGNIFGGSSSGGGTSWIEGYLGFAGGGGFRMGGAGGTDSQLAAFMMSPGEIAEVYTPGQMARRGGDGTIVQVINNSGEKSREERGRSSDGREIVRVIIGEVEKSLRKPGGTLNRAIGDTFGAKPSLATR